MADMYVKEGALKYQTRLRFEESWDSEKFYRFCEMNPDVVAELDAEGNLIMMSPANAAADGKNTEFNYQFMQWAKETNSGRIFGPTAGFTLPNGAVRSPDASLVKHQAWDALTKAEQQSFSPICPFFVMELRSSESDLLKDVKAKMEEYIANGAQLGWLIDPVTGTLTVYRPGPGTGAYRASRHLLRRSGTAGVYLRFRSDLGVTLATL